MGQIENYIADLQNVQDLYNLNWVLPYGSAYATANTQFKATLQSQADWDKMKMELFMTAATIGFGAGLGAMFGKAATVGSVAVDQALTAVCNRNMERTFNAMARISASVPGTFIVSQIWDTLGSKIGTAAKDQVQALVTRAPASAAIRDPQVMQNDMTAYVLRTKTAAHAVAADIRDNRNMTEAEKDTVARQMRAAPFFADAPRSDVIGNRQVAADTMELAFLMVLVMDSDYIEEHTDWQRGARDGTTTRRLGGVSLSTSDPRYGVTAPMRSTSGLGASSNTITYVAYDRPGGRILDRINVLHNQRLGSTFFPNGWLDFQSYGRDEIARAERALARLNQQVLGPGNI